MDAAVFKKIHPLDYHRQFHRENIRPDGRSLHKSRKIVINKGSISTADGSALVRVGQTMVICGIKAEISVPAIDHPKRGFIVINVEQSAMGTAEGRPGPPTDDVQALSARITSIMMAQREFKDLLGNQLVISPARYVWCLYADICCLNDDGSLFDACLLAVTAALINTRLPQATIAPSPSSGAMDEIGGGGVDESHQRRSSEANEPELCTSAVSGDRQPLSCPCLMVPMTFALFENPSNDDAEIVSMAETKPPPLILVDPSAEEQQLCQGQIHIVAKLPPLLPYSPKSKLCGAVIKTGGMAVPVDIMNNCLEQALADKRLAEVQVKLMK